MGLLSPSEGAAACSGGSDTTFYVGITDHGVKPGEDVRWP
jgi:hypothetical protein